MRTFTGANLDFTITFMAVKHNFMQSDLC